MNESERNVSLYDDGNGSFVDDIPEGDGFLFENAEEKMKQLAI